MAWCPHGAWSPASVASQRTTSGTQSSLSLFGCQGWNSGLPVWRQAALVSESSHLPHFVFLTEDLLLAWSLPSAGLGPVTLGVGADYAVTFRDLRIHTKPQGGSSPGCVPQDNLRGSRKHPSGTERLDEVCV